MKKGFFALLGAIFAACSLSFSQAEVRVTTQGIHASPPTSTTTAGYFSLNNTAQHPVTVKAVDCKHPAITRCELHETQHHGQQAHMHQTELTLSAGQTHSLEPGGLHLMLWLSEPLTAADTVDIVLRFDSQQELAFTLPVLGLSTHENH